MDDEDLGYFYDDAVDQLQFMENALLDAKDGTNDSEKIGEIFRAMHTIKGTAGMFEFDEIVNLTHKAENLLDEIRDEKVVFTASLSTLFMSVKDTTTALVENVVNGLELDDNIKQGQSTLEKQLLQNMPNYSSDTSTQIEEDTKINPNNSNSTSNIWHISLRLKPEFLKTGMDIISIIKFMEEIGKLQTVKTIANDIPSFEQYDPISTYIGFEIRYKHDGTKEDVEEIFEFIEDDIDLIFFKSDDKKEFDDLIAKREPYIKQILEDDFGYEDEIKIPTPKVEQETKKTVEVKSKEKDFFLKVNSKKIDEIINKVSQMVIANAQVLGHTQNNDDEELQDMLTNIETLLEDVRDSVLDVRMVQVKDSFIKYRRIVNDTATKLNKQIDFILEGEDTELDKSVVEKLSDPLTHMIRNSVDHGVEMPDIRVANGKSPQGKVILRAYPDAGTIVIELEDDGAGINKEAVLKKAIANGIVSVDHNLSDKEIYMLIFAAGLSTADSVSNISGRGVGMDVVRRNIEELRGVIEVESTPNKGSKIIIRLPLTLAIIDGFLVQSGHDKFIIPVDMITQCIELTDEYKSDIKDAHTIMVRGEMLPLLNLRKFYDDKITQEELDSDENRYRQNVIIVRFGSSEVGLLTDELYGQQQTVIKPLGGIFKNIPGISGGSILGSGEIAYILDIPKLIEKQIKQRK